MTNSQPNDRTNRDEIDLLPLVGSLWRGRFIVIGITAICILASACYTYVIATPMYPAQATVALNQQQQQTITGIESVLSGAGSDAVSINTEVEVFRSRNLLGQLVDRLGLANDPEFNPALREPGLRTRILRGIGLARQPAAQIDGIARNQVIDILQNRLNISNIRQSLAFTLSITTTDPQKSALIINSFAEIYIESQIMAKLEAAAQATEFLSRRTSELQQSLEGLEQDLARTMEQSDVVNQEVLQAQNLQLRDLRERITDQTRRNATAQAVVDRLTAATALSDLITVAETSGDVALERIAFAYRNNRLDDQQAQAALDTQVQDMVEDGRRDLAQLQSLQSSAEALSAQIQTQSDELIVLQQLEREVESARLLYQSFLMRLQETNVQQGLEAADSRILSDAVPRGASSPRHGRNLGLAALLGIILGGGIVLLREMLFSGFRSPDELRAGSGETVLASIPLFGNGNRKETLQHMRENPNSVASESVRNLRTSILMSNIDRPPQVMLVTSSVPGEGKTTTAIALARNLTAMEGKRVLLVEADMRRKSLRSYVENDTIISLIDVLMGQVDINHVDLWNDDLGVNVLAGSDARMNATDLFASNRFGDLMAMLRRDYDHIVIDTPPVLAVPDARVIATHADAVIYAVHWSRTTRMQVRQGLEMLESIGISLTGTVLTQVDTKKMKSYGYGGQYGYDGYASKYYSEG